MVGLIDKIEIYQIRYNDYYTKVVGLIDSTITENRKLNKNNNYIKMLA